ncbi:MAG: hypothetical protein Q8L90_03380, partial [Bacteroidota bacterium]|nr:hypothetical protein [Bacteroidota bacterium]
MKKIFSSLSILFLAISISYGQKDKTYYSLAEALKTPLKVYSLNLNHSQLTTLPETISKFTNLSKLSLSN